MKSLTTKLLTFTVLGLASTVFATEKVHTIHETPTHTCNKLFDVLEEDSYVNIDEIV